MFSLRKRAKLEEACIQNYSHGLSLHDLPIEILYSILDTLSLKDLLNLRLVNRFFKQLLNNSFYFANVVINLEKHLNYDPELLSQFWQSNTKLDTIVYSYEKTCTKNLVPELSLLRDGDDSRPLSLVVPYLNILSLHVLNSFADACTSLEINCFLVPSTGEVLKAKQREYMNRQIIQFSRLESGVVDFMRYDDGIEQSYVWNDRNLKSFLAFQFLSLFYNVKELNLFNYEGSLADIVRTLHKLKNLKCLQLDDCRSCNDLVSTAGSELPTKIPMSKHRQSLHVKSLMFDKTAPSTVLFVLTCVANATHLTNLSLYLNKFNCYADQPKIVLWIFQIVNELKSLRHFTTDIFHQYENDTARFAGMQEKNFYSYLISQLKSLNLNSLSLLNGSGKKNTWQTKCQFSFDNFLQLFENELAFLSSISNFVIDITFNCVDLHDSRERFIKFVASHCKEAVFEIFLNCFDCKENCCSSSCLFKKLVGQQKANLNKIYFEIRL